MKKLVPYLLALGVSLTWWGCEWQTPDDFEVKGIDVSHYQKHIHWDSVAAAGMEFVFVKATEGRELSDSLFCRNWDELRRVGLRRGAYHFFRPGVPAEEQARNFIHWVDLQPGDLPPVLDVELIEDLTRRELHEQLRTWLDMVEAAYHVRPIIYTYVRFYNRHLRGVFPDHPLWIARYNERAPRLPGDREWHFWQYDNKGRIAGIGQPVDFNVFNGTLGRLDSLCIGGPRATLSRSATGEARLLVWRRVKGDGVRERWSDGVRSEE